MRRKRDLDRLVDVEPLRVMIHLFGHERRARHETERLIEILEDELANDRIAAIDLAPVGQTGECGLPCRSFESRHRVLLTSVCARITAMPMLAPWTGRTLKPPRWTKSS